MSISVAVDGQRVDGVDLVAGCEQRLHQKTSIGLDSNHDFTRLFGMFGDKGMDAANAVQAVCHLCSAEYLALLVQHADVVLLFCPVNTQEDHRHLLTYLLEPEEVHHDLMVQCSQARHPTSGWPPRQAPAARSLPRDSCLRD